MSDKSRKKKLTILIVLLALLSISMFSQLTQERSAVAPASKSQRNQYAANAAAGGTLQVDLLSKQHPEFSGVKRNIFQFGRGAGEEPISNGDQPPITPVPAVPQPPPLPQVFYLGFYFEKDTGVKLAALSTNGKILVGKVGQTVAGRFHIVDIAADHVVLTLPADEGKMLRVPLGKLPPSVIEQEQGQPE